MKVLRDALSGLAEESAEGNSDGGVCLVKRDERGMVAHTRMPQGGVVSSSLLGLKRERSGDTQSAESSRTELT